jgi:hypothetical protein
VVLLSHFPDERATVPGPQPYLPFGWGFGLAASVAGLIFPEWCSPTRTVTNEQTTAQPRALLPFPRTGSRSVPDVMNDDLVVPDLIHDQIFANRKS